MLRTGGDSGPRGELPKGTSRFALDSRGDLVQGRVVVPAADGPHPLVVLIGPDGGADSPWVDRAITALSGWSAVAAFDLPLCGRRRSDKLPLSILDAKTAQAAALRAELEVQLGADLERSIRFLGESATIDSTRVAILASGFGASLARRLAERADRPTSIVATIDAAADPDRLAKLAEELRSRLERGS